MSLSRGSKRNSWRRRPAGRPSKTSTPTGRELEQRDLGRVTGGPVPAGRAGRRCCRRPPPGRAGRPPSAPAAAVGGWAACPGLASPPRGPDGGDAHPVLGQGAGLVGADDRGGPQGLHRRQPLDQGAAAGHLAHPDGQRQGDGGQQSFRDVGDQQPDREAGRRGHAQPGGQADRQERDPGPYGDERDQPGGPLDLVLQRAFAAGPTRWLRAAIRPSSVPIPVRSPAPAPRRRCRRFR